MKSLCIILLGLVLSAIPLTPIALPMSVFVVHCEPTRANSLMWNELVKLVALTDVYRVPLSIDFTPQRVGILLHDLDDSTREAITNEGR